MPNLNHSDSLRPAPWSFWPTLGLLLLIIVGYFIGGIVISVVYILWEVRQDPSLASSIAESEFLANLANNGTFLAWNTLFSGLVGLYLIGLAIRLKTGWTYQSYNNFIRPKWTGMLIWNGLLIGLLILQGQAAQFFQKKSDFMENIVASDETNVFLLSLAVVIMAPLFEEVLFRGFVFKGLEKSPVGVVGAVLIPSLIWAVMHLQYEPFFMGIIFVLGILLGYARHVTKSLWVPIAMHTLNNGLAMLGAYGWLQTIVIN